MSILPEQTFYSAGAVLCASIGSVYDIREHRIPNRLSGAAIVAALLLHGFAAGWMQAAGAAAAGLIGGGLFVLFYLAGGMGAGDVKLMIAVGCWMGLPPLSIMLVATAVAGSLLGLAVAIRKRQLRQTISNVVSILSHHSEAGLTPHPEFNVQNPGLLRLPFAVPITFGCLVAAGAVMWRG